MIFDNKDFSQRMILKGINSATGGQDNNVNQVLHYNKEGIKFKGTAIVTDDEEDRIIEDAGDMMVEEFDFVGDNYNEEYVKV